MHLQLGSDPRSLHTKLWDPSPVLLLSTITRHFQAPWDLPCQAPSQKSQALVSQLFCYFLWQYLSRTQQEEDRDGGKATCPSSWAHISSGKRQDFLPLRLLRAYLADTYQYCHYHCHCHHCKIVRRLGWEMTAKKKKEAGTFPPLSHPRKPPTLQNRKGALFAPMKFFRSLLRAPFQVFGLIWVQARRYRKGRGLGKGNSSVQLYFKFFFLLQTVGYYLISKWSDSWLTHSSRVYNCVQ